METTMGSWEKVDDLLEEIEHLRYYLSEDEFKDVFVKEKFNQRVVESLRRERQERLHREKQPVIIVDENMSNETSTTTTTTTSTKCDNLPDDFEINETVEQSKKRKGKNIINSPPHETNKCDNKCDDFEINERVEQSRKRQGKNIISSNKRLKQEKKSKKKTVFRKKKDGDRHGGPIVEELPREYIESINILNGREVKLVAQKKLTSTDVSEYHNRVTFSENNEVINNDFLNIQEIQILRRKEKLCVRLLVPSNLDGGVTTMVSMSKWEMNGNWYYAFVTPWKKVVLENGFKAGQVVQVWSFRYDDGEGVDRLGFAVVRVHEAGQSSGGSSDGVKTYEVGESSGGGKGVEIHEVGESSGGGKDVEIHDVGQSNGGSNGGDSGGGSGGSNDGSCGSSGDSSDGSGSTVVRKGSDGRVIKIRFKGVRICNDS